MKKVFTLLMLALFSGATVFAQRNVAVLKLRLSDRSAIAVRLDGNYIDRQTTTLTLDGLRPGMHRLEVYADAGYRRRPVRVYTGTLRLQPATVHVGVVDVYNRGLRLRTRPADDRDYAVRDGDYSRDGSYGDGYDRQRDRSQPDDRNDWGDERGDRGSQRDDRNYDGRDNDGQGQGYGSFPRGRSGSTGTQLNSFSQRDMDDLRSRVNSRITDTDKEQLMKNVLQSRFATTAQVREMLGWLSFDTTKLSFAKWAYDHVSDPREYWKLEDVFSFQSSKDEFSKAISR